MCGIAGILNFDGSLVASSKLRSMTLNLAHRGPDNMGLWIEENIGFGHRRLSIRDLSSAGNQPMLDPSERVVVVFVENIQLRKA